MNGILVLISLVFATIIILVVPSLVAPYNFDYGTVDVFYTGKAVLLCALLASVAGYFAFTQAENGTFLLRLFVAALLVRVLLGTAIFVFNYQEFFGGDANTYDFFGLAQLEGWRGDRYSNTLVTNFIGASYFSGWGMVYLVAGIYGLLGRNLLAVQFVNSVMGAATAVVIFMCAHHIFTNQRVARLAALAVAFYPSLVLWSSQGLKDGPIVFFLALAILSTLKLGQKISVKHMAVLIFSLFLLLSFRFYLFYMIAVAIVGAFIIGMQTLTPTHFARQFIVIIALGLAFTYLGVTRYANLQIEQFASLEKVQRSRLDAATSAESGFGRDVDVSTAEGALTTIPMGLVYLLFAPFPWQLVSLRQSITLPEMILWWVSFPMFITGLWFSMRYRLRQMSPMLIFTAMLSLAYSVFQGNVGTAYRQRAQLLVFYFIFVAVGYVLLLEKREEKKRQEVMARETLLSRTAQ